MACKQPFGLTAKNKASGHRSQLAAVGLADEHHALGVGDRQVEVGTASGFELAAAGDQFPDFFPGKPHPEQVADDREVAAAAVARRPVEPAHEFLDLGSTAWGLARQNVEYDLAGLVW